jgi:hypothetical protein
MKTFHVKLAMPMANKRMRSLNSQKAAILKRKKQNLRIKQLSVDIAFQQKLDP